MLGVFCVPELAGVRDVVGTGGSDFDLLVEMRSERGCVFCVCACQCSKSNVRQALDLCAKRGACRLLTKQGLYNIWAFT